MTTMTTKQPRTVKTSAPKSGGKGGVLRDGVDFKVRDLALAELGRTREAAAAFRTALRLDPGYAPAQEGLAGLGLR